MKYFETAHFLVLGVIVLNSCGEANNVNSVIERESTSIDTFQHLTSFSYHIKEVHWSMEIHKNDAGRDIPGPGDWSLFAQVECDSIQIAAIRKILDNGNSKIANQMYVSSRLKKKWLSAETKDCFYANGSYSLFKSNIYKVDKSLFPLNSNNGWFAIVGNKTIFLVLRS